MPCLFILKGYLKILQFPITEIFYLNTHGFHKEIYSTRYISLYFAFTKHISRMKSKDQLTLKPNIHLVTCSSWTKSDQHMLVRFVV